MPVDSLEPPASDELEDDEGIDDEAPDEVTSADVLVEVASPVLVESTVCDVEASQALLTRRMRIAVASRT